MTARHDATRCRWHAPRGGLERKARGCLGVAFGTTGTVASARRVLPMIHDADVQAAARHYLDQIARETSG